MLVVLQYIYLCSVYACRPAGGIDVLYIVKSRTLIACVLISAVDLPNMLKRKTRKSIYTTSVATTSVLQQM